MSLAYCALVMSDLRRVDSLCPTISPVGFPSSSTISIRAAGSSLEPVTLTGILGTLPSRTIWRTIPRAVPPLEFQETLSPVEIDILFLYEYGFDKDRNFIGVRIRFSSERKVSLFTNTERYLTVVGNLRSIK